MHTHTYHLNLLEKGKVTNHRFTALLNRLHRTREYRSIERASMMREARNRMLIGPTGARKTPSSLVFVVRVVNCMEMCVSFPIEMYLSPLRINQSSRVGEIDWRMMSFSFSVRHRHFPPMRIASVFLSDQPKEREIERFIQWTAAKERREKEKKEKKERSQLRLVIEKINFCKRHLTRSTDIAKAAVKTIIWSFLSDVLVRTRHKLCILRLHRCGIPFHLWTWLQLHFVHFAPPRSTTTVHLPSPHRRIQVRKNPRRCSTPHSPSIRCSIKIHRIHLDINQPRRFQLQLQLINNIFSAHSFNIIHMQRHFVLFSMVQRVFSPRPQVPTNRPLFCQQQRNSRVICTTKISFNNSRRPIVPTMSIRENRRLHQVSEAPLALLIESSLFTRFHPVCWREVLLISNEKNNYRCLFVLTHHCILWLSQGRVKTQQIDSPASCQIELTVWENKWLTSRWEIHFHRSDRQTDNALIEEKRDYIFPPPASNRQWRHSRQDEEISSFTCSTSNKKRIHSAE